MNRTQVLNDLKQRYSDEYGMTTMETEESFEYALIDKLFDYIEGLEKGSNELKDTPSHILGDTAEFEIQHLFFKKDLVICTEATFPDWMTRKDIQWRVSGYVLKLKVGESIKSDFHKITRLK